MKITVRAQRHGFIATTDKSTKIYCGDSEPEALGEAVRAEIQSIPGLEIVSEPKSVEQLKYEERRRVNTAGCGND